MTARRFEFRDAKSAKFWQIEATEHRTITTWGRIGTDGQTKAKEFASAAKATADADKKIAEKLKKGYTETGTVASGVVPPVTEPASATAADADPAPAPETPATPAEPVEPVEPVETERAVAPATDPAIKEPSGGLDAEPIPEPDFPEWTMSRAWQDKVLARRDRPSTIFALSPKPNPEKAATVFAIELARPQKQSWIQTHVVPGAVDPEIAALVHEPPARPDATNPTHVSAFSLMLRILSHSDRSFSSYAHFIVDDWVANAGLAFTVGIVEDTRWWRMPGEWSHGSHSRSTTFERVTPDSQTLSSSGALLPRLRNALARADDADYESARQVAQSLRTQSTSSNLRMSYLFPTETEWVDEAIASATHAAYHGPCHLDTVATTDRLDAALALRHSSPRMSSWQPNTLPTLLATLGADLVPYLGLWLGGQIFEGGPIDTNVDAETRKAYVQALCFVGNDEAFDQLASMAEHKHVLPGLTSLATERPHAAIRALTPHARATGARAKVIENIVRSVVRENPGVAAAVLDELDAADRAQVESLADRSAEKPTASDDLVHPLLVDPPWNNRAKQSERTVVEGVESIAIEPALGEGLLAKAPRIYRSRDSLDQPSPDWEEQAQRVLDGRNPLVDQTSYNAHYNLAWFFDRAPIDVIESLLPRWSMPSDANVWTIRAVAQVLLHRLGTGAVATVDEAAASNLTGVIEIAENIASTRLALPFADALERKKSLRSRAADWLETNVEHAVHGLVPHAVGPAGADQHAAANALRFIVKSNRPEIERIAAEYGTEVEQAVAELLDFDELQVLPKRMPKLPEYVSMASVTLPLLADRKHQLPPAATENLLTMLAISKSDEPYPGIALVKPTLDAASTAAFAWDIFEAWRSAGMPSKHGWILAALGQLGNDDTVRSLTPIIRAWPGEGGHKRAVNGLDALADIGTDLALMQLFAMSRKLKFKGLKNKAAEKVQQIAERRDLTPDQLADRLVPDLDLDANGSRVIDYGTRTFTVGFDEQLKPFVRDEEGKIRKALPKPGQKDDPERAPLAYKEFGALKKDARAVAADQLDRLEQAMVRQRRWTTDEFTEYFLDHPLIIHLVRRLIWGVYEEDTMVASYRVAEDRSLATSEDDEFELPSGATIGIAHPLDIDEATRAAWGEVLSDYEMLQPFAQIARECFEMTADELDSNQFTRFVGPSLPFGKYLGLEKRGWIRGRPQDGGVSPNLYRPLPDGRAIHLELEEGLWTGYIQETPDQPIRRVWIGDSHQSWFNKNGDQRFSSLTPITISELLRDLTDLFG